jgi:para-nitrobenzyl esterase
MIMKNYLAAAAALALGFSAAAAAASPVVSVTGGKVQGETQGGLLVFKGIPYAAPPVGNLRWRAPQRPAAWSGVRAATAYGAPCMQAKSFLVPPDGPAPSEDCLYLNIWTPAKPADRLPVMVWIHGGGFTQGNPNATMFDGGALAHHGVVVVNIAYRLGQFGFMADPELSAESGGHGSGLYGIQDQIAALKWVRDNITAFGGDPSKVTIFGQSAGAASVGILAASPQARGLFRGAIAESGSATMMGRYSTLKTAEGQGEAALAAAGAPTIAQARKLSAEAVLKIPGRFGPILDGYVITADTGAVYAAGRQNDTPVLLGFNSNEGAIGGPLGAASGGMAFNAWAWARLQTKAGKGKVYGYYFDKLAPKDSVFYSAKGTVHTGEVPYVFGSFDPPASYTAEDKALSANLVTYWSNFAKTGNPNGAGLAPWPAFNPSTGAWMQFGATSKAGVIPGFEQLKAQSTG